jgi:Ca-activated chloride channel homolog
VSTLSSSKSLFLVLCGVFLLSLYTFALRTPMVGKRQPEYHPYLAAPEETQSLAQTAPLSSKSPPAPLSATLAARDHMSGAPSASSVVRAESALSADHNVLSAPIPGEPLSQPDFRLPSEPVNRERYAAITANPVQRVAEQPVSTFSIDVDTGAYANVRRVLHSGTLPVRDAVRVEELINYFSYDYPPPDTAATPFRLTTEVAPTPWNPHTLLLLLGLKGVVVSQPELPPTNLVFLVDVSGSMQSPDKLDLVKSALLLLCRQLRGSDRISLVVYAGASGVVLEPTPGDQTGKIQAAIKSLTAGGSTNGGAGIRLAYALAEQAYIRGGINRVLLATDGDFNVGTVSLAALKDLIAEQRKRGIALTTLGVGSGNYNDALMEQLADIGNGTYAYLDSLQEAQKVLVNERAATLHTIAKDVKIQLEFNAAVVAEYRLIGYENRVLRREDFANAAVDAGEIGVGHTVTALYEIALAGTKGLRLEPLRYAPPAPTAEGNTTELGFLRLRYKAPESETSQVLEWPLTKDSITPAVDRTTERFRFAAAVAAFGQLLRGGTYTGTFGYADVLTLARGARTDDPFGQKGEFVSLVQLTQSLSQTGAGVQR